MGFSKCLYEHSEFQEFRSFSQLLANLQTVFLIIVLGQITFLLFKAKALGLVTKGLSLKFYKLSCADFPTLNLKF